MGLLELGRKRFFEAGGWLIRSIERFAKVKDSYNARKAVGAFLRVYKAAPAEQRTRLKRMFEEAGLGDIEK